jgi:hypothetical protein
MKERMGINVVLFQDFSSLWEVWSFCSSNFKFFANNLKLKNELSLLRVVHYENDERVLISTHTFIYVNMSVYVCAIPEGRSAVALNQQPLELVASL